jgi:hypothetical protein
VGRDTVPPDVPGRFGGDVPEVCLVFADVFTLTLRLPEAGPGLPGIFAFIGDLCGDLGGDPFETLLL